MTLATIFATKGIEYLLVLAYLAILIPVWMFLVDSRGRDVARQAAARLLDLAGEWFRLPEGFYFHRGHSWAVPERADVMRVGLDEFAGKLVGPTALRLPESGTRLEQGEAGWQLEVGDRVIDMLSPVRGTVVTVNERVIENPQLAADDPYGSGWLLEVRVPSAQAMLRNLTPAKQARSWMADAVEELRLHQSNDLGPVLQDGGLPVFGFGRELSPDNWHELAASFFLTSNADN